MDDMEALFNNENKPDGKETLKNILIVLVVLLVTGVIIFVAMKRNEEAQKKAEKEPIPYEEIDFSTDDISSMEFALDGHVLTFPLTMRELEDTGYIVEADCRNEVVPAMTSTMYYYVTGYAKTDFGSSIFFHACNFTEGSKKVMQCDVRSISAQDEHFVLCNGITMSTSYDEVIAIMGNPTKEEEGYNSKTLTYEIEGKYSVYIKYLYGNYEEMDTLMVTDKSY